MTNMKYFNNVSSSGTVVPKSERLLVGGLLSHFSSFFRLFAPEFWEVVGTFEWYFVTI